MTRPYQLLHGDCLEHLRAMPAASVDSIVTDPPYGLSFMGKRWDYDVPSVEIWGECLRVLKPGGHLLAFAGTRTQHRMAVRIEDAGFEIRDMIAWVYGSGFPKSHNLAGDWQGWGTALKPALEPITVARKPPSGTIAETVLAHGTGALNIDGCRISLERDENLQGGASTRGRNFTHEAWRRPWMNDHDKVQERIKIEQQKAAHAENNGRFPSNFIHDGGPEVDTLLRDAARFFYCAKASAEDRDEGLGKDARNHHPTVKPTDLMRYLCRLVTPPGGLVLDPFAGSGSTGKAAMLERFRFIGIEREADYVALAEARIAAAAERRPML